MSVEEVKCLGEGLLTYRRKKRKKTAESSDQQKTPIIKIEDDEPAENPCEAILHANSICSHWKTVLQSMLQLPNIREASGIQQSINDALVCGPDSCKLKMDNTPKYFSELKDRFESHCEVPARSRREDILTNALMDGTETETYDQANTVGNKLKPQDALCSILCSDKFVVLCNLLCERFKGCRIDNLLDINQINSNMQNGAYEKSPSLLDHDIQQMWKNFQKLGEEMILLASSLLNISHDIYQKQVGEDIVNEACSQKCEGSHQVFVPKKSNYSATTINLLSSESSPTGKMLASGLHRLCMCKKCGTETDVKSSLICDQCEAVYHFFCVEPSFQEIPTRSWYCASCATCTKKRSSKYRINNPIQGSLHDSCVVCERLENSDTKEENGSEKNSMANGSRDSLDSSMEYDEEPPEPSRTALAHLCKQCGTCEDEDRRFLVCGHNQCPYKYYHIRCLKTSQTATLQQRGLNCWYCPSCLCRACFLNKDDDKIVLCDGCDEAYHTYCMKPPRNCIPKGQWYCLRCNIAKAKEGMRRYEQWVLKQVKKDGK